MIDTKTLVRIDAHFSNNGDVIVSFVQYPLSSMVIITKDDARQFADEIYALLNEPAVIDAEIRRAA